MTKHQLLMPIVWSVVGAIVLVLAGCGGAEDAAPTGPEPTSSTTDRRATAATEAEPEAEAAGSEAYCGGEPVTSEPLVELDAKIASGDCGSISSLLVWHDGQTVFESYYGASGPDRLNQVWSVTKSVTSAMVGKALSDGDVASLDDQVLRYLSEYQQVADLDDRKANITLADLLTMRAGFDWDEVSNSYRSGRFNDATSMTSQEDWVEYVLDHEIESEPGERFAYNSGATILLSGILEEATGQSLESYAEKNLFGPLGIVDWRWESTSEGIGNGAWGLWLTTEDMLKFGLLYLQDGMWDGDQLVPAQWVEQSTRSWVQDASPALSVRGRLLEYGYQWWRFSDQDPVVVDLAENDLFFASGFGGNLILIATHLDLVVVVTGANYGEGGLIFPALKDYVLPVFLTS